MTAIKSPERNNTSPKKLKVLTLRPSNMLMSLFLWTDLEKRSITSLAHQWIISSEWVPSEWGSKRLIKTSQVTHTTQDHQLMSSEVKNCVFVRKKNPWLRYYFTSIGVWLKVLSQKYVFLRWKSHLDWIRREICTGQTPLTTKNHPKSWLIFMRRQQRIDFSTW